MFGCSAVEFFTVDMLVSANEVNLDYQINLFPNPTTGEVNIEFDLDKQQAVEVNLYDVSGRLVLPPYGQSIRNERIQLDLNNLAKGIYLAKIKVAEGILVKKIVLN